MSIGRGSGKVILLGEHAVVYGHPALAAALDLGVVAETMPSSEPRLQVPAWDIDCPITSELAPARAFRALAAELGEDVSQIGLRAEATVPARAGLGSSAAFSVAAARALLPGVELGRLAQAAGAAEDVFHGKASGVDVALASRGGLGLFTRADGLRPLGEVAPFQLVIGLSGEPRDTAARVADVARQRDHARKRTDERLDRLGKRALGGALALKRADLSLLGGLLDDAQDDLAFLKLSTPRLDALCAAARQAGALGAKLTGAGGGGAMIALPAPGTAEAILAALTALSASPRLVTLGSGAHA